MADIAFQANAFQVTYPGIFYAFQAVDRYLTVSGNLRIRDYLILNIGPLMKDYARTSVVVLEVYIYDPSTTPAILFDPTSVQLNLFNPDGTTELSLQAMSKISTGFYRYLWQSASNDQLGVYTGNIKATDGANVFQTITQGCFRLVTN